MAERVPKDADEILRQVREQFDLLINAGDTFDQGHEVLALPLATCLRVLLHDTQTWPSALTQLGKKQELHFFDSGGAPDAGLLVGPPLLAVHAGDGYRPKLDAWDRWSFPDMMARPPGHVGPFEVWWKAPVVDDLAGHVMSRADVVLAFANQEGGAHIDPASTPECQALARDNALGWKVGPSQSGPWTAVGSPLPATVRQIAWEVHYSVWNQAPELIPSHLRDVHPGRYYAPRSRLRTLARRFGFKGGEL
jgi:hypothetical protein